MSYKTFFLAILVCLLGRSEVSGQNSQPAIEVNWEAVKPDKELDFETVLTSYDKQDFSLSLSFWADNQVDLLRSQVFGESLGLNLGCAWNLGLIELNFLIQNALNLESGDFDIEPEPIDYSMAHRAYSFSHRSISSISVAAVFTF